jgi:archaellum component FlaC
VEPAVLIAFITALSSLAGVLWVIYSGRKNLKQTATVNMFDQAMQLVSAKEDEITRLTARVTAQDKLIARLAHQIEVLKRRVNRLIDALSRATKVPVEVLKLQDLAADTDDDEEENI